MSEFWDLKKVAIAENRLPFIIGLINIQIITLTHSLQIYSVNLEPDFPDQIKCDMTNQGLKWPTVKAYF